MNLYQVRDGDGIYWVLAESMVDAVAKWGRWVSDKDGPLLEPDACEVFDGEVVYVKPEPAHAD